jgi:hypothetical protein
MDVAEGLTAEWRMRAIVFAGPGLPLSCRSSPVPAVVVP